VLLPLLQLLLLLLALLLPLLRLCHQGWLLLLWQLPVMCLRQAWLLPALW
jgi:hypothetical protein